MILKWLEIVIDLICTPGVIYTNKFDYAKMNFYTMVEIIYDNL